jgi:hypothetical protein
MKWASDEFWLHNHRTLSSPSAVTGRRCTLLLAGCFPIHLSISRVFSMAGANLLTSHYAPRSHDRDKLWFSLVSTTAANRFFKISSPAFWAVVPRDLTSL